MQPSLFDEPEPAPQEGPLDPPDQAARDFATDPANDVVLEASAGTGKTRVLVDRYVRLIAAGVDPKHILAITFTRKAAAEMRERVLIELRRQAGLGQLPDKIWRGLRDRVSEIQVSTIDAFCFGLLREFPLEADVDPAFDIADETEIARFTSEALELTMRAARRATADDEHVRLLLARVKGPVLRNALAPLIDRRHVALPAVRTYVSRLSGPTTADEVAGNFIAAVQTLFRTSPHRQDFLQHGPHAAAEFRWLHADLLHLDDWNDVSPARVQQLRRRLERYFLTVAGTARQKLSKPFDASAFVSPAARKLHEHALKSLSEGVLPILKTLESEVSGLLARGVLRLLTIAARVYDGLLAEHTLLDFAGMLDRAVALLSRQEEFARSRLKLQSRYHHLLVDEFQDTSRLQWRLIELLVDTWGEGESVADAPTSIFVVGDRKQSIYRFRHAEVSLLDEAADKIAALRLGRPVRRAISASFRAVPELLGFVNALASSMVRSSDDPAASDERFTYSDHDRFPVPEIAPGARRDGAPVLGLIAESTIDACALAVAAEVQRLLAGSNVRDRNGAVRPATPDDVAILFRARAGHQYFEQALEAHGIRAYVYKGLGFFDAPEVQDLQALLRYLAQPDSDLRAAELLRSRFVRVSDITLTRLAPRGFAHVLTADDLDDEVLASDGVDDLDRALIARVRAGLRGWLDIADRVPPSELLDRVMHDTAYVYEMRGRRFDQARENVKKVRALVRRVESRGYTTLGRLAAYFETLRTGDESNAIISAKGAVTLMTMHAAKGLEFPIVFLVNLHASAAARNAGFSVIERGPTGEPEVAFGSTPATRLDDERDAEEMRRLFYVGVTRARDRLYLASRVEKGHPGKRPRSLASLLPATLASAFTTAAETDAAEVEWPSARGTFAFAVCRPANAGANVRGLVAPDPLGAPMTAPALPLLAVNPSIATVEQLALAATASAPEPAGPAAPSDRLTGTLVHRLLQAAFAPGVEPARLRDYARRLVELDRFGVGSRDLDASDGAASAAVELYLRLCQRPDVIEILSSGECLYEVPFSEVQPGGDSGTTASVVRGVVDCLVLHGDGSGTVVEFKTGRPRPEHRVQAEFYARAMARVLQIPEVGVKILYA